MSIGLVNLGTMECRPMTQEEADIYATAEFARDARTRAQIALEDRREIEDRRTDFMHQEKAGIKALSLADAVEQGAVELPGAIQAKLIKWNVVTRGSIFEH